MSRDRIGFTPEQITELEQPLDPSRAVQNKNVFGTYLEGFDVINRANEIFGFDGWTSTGSITYLADLQSFLAECTVTAGGVSHHDVASAPIMLSDLEAKHFGKQGGLNWKQVDANIHRAATTASTTALKRALRHFGEQFGNSLYDKNSPLHDQARNSDAPKVAQIATYVCAECSTPIYDTVKGGVVTVSADEKANISKQRTGHVLCYKHLNEAIARQETGA